MCVQGHRGWANGRSHLLRHADARVSQIIKSRGIPGWSKRRAQAQHTLFRAERCAQYHTCLTNPPWQPATAAMADFYSTRRHRQRRQSIACQPASSSQGADQQQLTSRGKSRISSRGQGRPCLRWERCRTWCLRPRRPRLGTQMAPVCGAAEGRRECDRAPNV